MASKAFISLVLLAAKHEIIKKLVFSRPRAGETLKVSGRLCSHRGRTLLALEYSLPGNTVSHKNVKKEDMPEALSELIGNYKQANLITTEGDAEWKLSSSGKEVLLGGDKLQRKLSAVAPSFESAIEALDNKKNYLLRGNEDFLIRLGVSDRDGRVHDKRQGKFRQINRFLEHIEDIYRSLPCDGELLIYDLCCGKSYLSFAVYYYLHHVKDRDVRMLCIDLKRDVIGWCATLAADLKYTGMSFICDDIKNTPTDRAPDMVISLHACDIATDIVLNRAIELGAAVILSTPCCHRYLNDRIDNDMLSFVTDYPQLRNKLCEAMTDAIRLARLSASGYDVSALELTDPDDTPKNTLLRAIKNDRTSTSVIERRQKRYEDILCYLLKDGKDEYLKGI